MPNYEYNLFNNVVPASLNGAGMNFMPTWGCPIPNPTPFYSPLSSLDEANAETSYHLDAGANCWVLEYVRGFRVRKRFKLMEGFTVDSVRYVYNMCCTQLQAVVVTYTDRSGAHTAVIPADDFRAGKLLIYFPSLVRLPDCTKRQANDLLEFLIRKVPLSETVQLYSHQGFLTLPDGGITFVAVPFVQSDLRELCPKSCIMRNWRHVNLNPSDVLSEWSGIYCGHPVLKTLALLRIAALLLAFAPPQIQQSQLVWVIQPSIGVSEEQLVAILNANDCERYPTPILNAGSKKLQEALSEVWDGAAVFADHSFADEEDQRRDAMKLLLRAAHGDLNETEIGRNIITVISSNGAYTAKSLDSDRVVTLSTEGVKLEADSETIARVNGEVEAVIVETILRIAPIFQADALQNLTLINAEYAKLFGKEVAASITMLIAAMMFVEKAFQVELSGDGYAIWLENLENQQGSVMETDRAILQDFAAVLSEKLRSGAFDAVRRRNGFCIDPDSKTAIVSGNRLYLSSKMMKDVLAEMHTTPNHKSLVNALISEKVLNAKDGNTHPMDVHTHSGNHIRLYLYDISADILDADILDYLANLEQTAFWLTRIETPHFDFLPMLCSSTGLVAGRKVDYSLEENVSCYITGQSGFGKSYLLCQLMAANAAIGHQVVVLDGGRLFTQQTLCQKLPANFVNQHVQFHDVDISGLPVNLFRINRETSLPAQKRELMQILLAGIGELTTPQSNSLHTLLSKLLSGTTAGEQIQLEEFRSLLEEDGQSNASLMNRLKPLLDDLVEYKVQPQGWGDFLSNSKDIIVVSMDFEDSDIGKQIVNMMLHTLYEYQRENPQIPLDIFMDEIQNQDFGEKAPLRKIMKEGRKKHLSFYGATLDYYPRNTDLGSAMGKAGTQIFLHPTQNSEQLVAQELRFGKNDLARFDAMQRGDAIVKGAMYSKETERNMPTILSGQVRSFDENAGGFYKIL